MDSPSARHSVGLLSSPLTFHPSSGRSGSMHIAGVLARGHDRLPIGQHSRWHTRRRRYVGGHSLPWMDIFSNFSSLQLNRAKSTFGGFSLSAKETCGCSRILETPIGALLIRYLGVPLVDCRLWIQDWQPVLEKVETRLGGWGARILSRGGHLVLLKAVLAAILIYYMSISRMSTRVRRRLEKTMRNFFWRGSQPRNHGGRRSSHGL